LAAGHFLEVLVGSGQHLIGGVPLLSGLVAGRSTRQLNGRF
jgi:hypothetical protein